MGMRMPETCWAVFKWQVINLRSCCIWLVDSVEKVCQFVAAIELLLLMQAAMLLNHWHCEIRNSPLGCCADPRHRSCMLASLEETGFLSWQSRKRNAGGLWQMTHLFVLLPSLLPPLSLSPLILPPSILWLTGWEVSNFFHFTTAFTLQFLPAVLSSWYLPAHSSHSWNVLFRFIPYFFYLHVFSPVY